MTIPGNDMTASTPQPAAQHWSDCSLHNGPAFPPGPCDCGLLPPDAANPVTVIGPECFASADASVICWRGENYYRAPSGFRFRLARLLGVGR